MDPTISEGQRQRRHSAEEHPDGGVRRWLLQLLPRRGVAVTAGVVVVVVVVVVVAAVLGSKLQTQKVYGKTCGSVEVTGDVRLLEKYRRCVTIEGNLRVQLIEYNKNDPVVPLSNLVQVTGYVVLYRLSYLRTLHDLLPNLAVIRGRELFHGYSLVIFGNIFLQEPELGNLTHVLAGAVRMEKNLCRGPPHRWTLLSPAPTLNVIQEYGLCVYPLCEEQRTCANATSALHTLCTPYGGCYQGPQCHSECAGGCHAPHDPAACVACTNYRNGHTCIPDCSASATHTVHHLGYRCIREDQCAKEPWTLKTETGPHGARRMVCIRCTDNCYGTCRGAKVTTGNLGRQLLNCRRLEGNLEIMVSGGRNLTQQLEENLGQLQVVTGFLKVHGSDTLFSLNFLSRLEEIGGEELVHGRYALYVLDNEKLQDLWDWNHRNRRLKITKGMLFFQHNPLLCRNLIRDLASRAEVTPADRVHVSPADDTGPCYTEDLLVNVVSRSAGELYAFWKYNYVGHDDRFVIGYYLYYREAPHKVTLYQGRDACNDIIMWETVFVEYLRNDNSSKTMNHLKPYTQYAIYVDVYYTYGVKNASRSTIMYATTTVGEPSPVRGLKATPRANASTVLLSWRAPLVPNGPLRAYEVRYRRLEIPDPRTEHADRDVCRARKQEPETQAPASVPEGGEEEEEEQEEEEEEAAPQCCECPAVRMSKEERLFTRQHDINFQNFIWQNEMRKSVNDDDDEPTPASVNTTKPPAQGHQHSASTHGTPTPPAASPAGQGTTQGEEKQGNPRQRRRRSPLHPSAKPQERRRNKLLGAEKEKEAKGKQGQDEERHGGHGTQHNNTAVGYEERTRTTNTTTITLDDLTFLTHYQVRVRACHTTESDCGNWTVLNVTTPADLSMYKIKNFEVKQVQNNETKQSNESATSPRPASPRGHTLLLTWDPPPVPREDVLAYIIQYQLEGAPQTTRKNERCVPEEEGSMGEFSLQGLKFGTYTLQIKVRSRNGNGPPATRTVKLEEPHFYWSVLIVLLCGGICISMGIGIMEVLFWKRRKKTPEQPQGEESNQENKSYGEILLENTLKRLDASYVIPSDALKVEHLLGRGCFGKVYHGVLTQPSGEERPVAVKTLMKQVPNEDLQRFLDEAVVMQGIKTNFLVRLIGVVDNFPPIYVVMELMERGDLKTFLRTEGAWISNEKMIEMAVEAADGMAYLQAKNLVHRDLAARNCMLDAELTLKIGDFGLSRYVATDYYRKQSRGMLPVRWMAPESLKNGHYSARSDVWSYGVLLWELATGGKLPYEEYTDVIVDDLIISGKRLKRPIRGPSFFYPLMILCWALDSSQRPTFKRLVQRLLLETSTSYQEYFQGVSFFHSSSPCTLESLDDIDEGFNASGSSQEDAEAGDSGSSSSLQPFHCFARQNNPFSNEDMECQCNEEDIGADDDMVFLTPVEPNGRSSCAPLSCIASHGARHTPSTDTPNRNLFPTHCLTET